MSFREFSKRARAAAAQYGIRASMSQLNDAIALAVYGKKYSAAISAEGVGKLPPLPAVPPYIAKAARKFRIDGHALGMALHAGSEEQPSIVGNTVGDAVDWLAEQYPEEVQKLATDALFGLADPELIRHVLSSGYGASMAIAHAEWILAEGVIEFAGTSRRVIDILREDYFSSLAPKQCLYLDALSTSPLRLYLIESVQPGYSVQLRELGSLSGRSVIVRERTGSRPEIQGQAVAGRVLPIDDHHELAGGVLSFSLGMMHTIADRLRDASSAHEVSATIRSAWFWQFDPARPQLRFVSADDGEALRFITDTYRCSDLGLLAQRLENDQRMDGGLDDGWSLVHQGSDGRTRQMCGVHVEDEAAGLVTAFYQSATRADRFRATFEAIAGDVLEYLSRESKDPMDAIAELGHDQKRPRQPKIPDEQRSALIQDAYHHTYANWADQPLPAFGGSSPRQLLSVPGGEARVREMLATYESNENRMAAQDCREPISLDFMYLSLGLTPTSGAACAGDETGVMRSESYRVNEVWIVFRLLDESVSTTQGKANVFGLMDGASQFILNSHIAMADTPMGALDARRLLTQLKVPAAYPSSPAEQLLVPTNLDEPELTAEAKRLGMRVVRVHEDELLTMIGEARAGMAIQFASFVQSRTTGR